MPKDTADDLIPPELATIIRELRCAGYPVEIAVTVTARPGAQTAPRQSTQQAGPAQVAPASVS